MYLLVIVSYVSLYLLQNVHSSPIEPLEKRTSCSQDSLLKSLRVSAHLSDSHKYCSALLSIPVTKTLTAYTSTCVLSSYTEVQTIVHPLYLYNLQQLQSSPTPLSYNQASPTPSTIPGGAQSYGLPINKRDMLENLPKIFPTPTKSPTLDRELIRRDGPTAPIWLATTYPPSRLSSACSCLSVPAAATTTLSQGLFSIRITSTCTDYIPTTTVTYPAMCAPSLQVNAAQPGSHSFYEVTPNFPTPSKMDCCAACVAVFNCVWWKFNFGTVGNGWKPGSCHYAYYIGIEGYDAAPAICPNGETQGITNVTSAQIGREANNNDPGYNFGPCGGAYNNFESSEDSGLPDDAYLHACYLNPPSSNPPGCAS